MKEQLIDEQVYRYEEVYKKDGINGVKKQIKQDSKVCYKKSDDWETMFKLTAGINFALKNWEEKLYDF